MIACGNRGWIFGWAPISYEGTGTSSSAQEMKGGQFSWTTGQAYQKRPVEARLYTRA